MQNQQKYHSRTNNTQSGGLFRHSGTLHQAGQEQTDYYVILKSPMMDLKMAFLLPKGADSPPALIHIQNQVLHLFAECISVWCTHLFAMHSTHEIQTCYTLKWIYALPEQQESSLFKKKKKKFKLSEESAEIFQPIRVRKQIVWFGKIKLAGGLHSVDRLIPLLEISSGTHCNICIQYKIPPSHTVGIECYLLMKIKLNSLLLALRVISYLSMNHHLMYEDQLLHHLIPSSTLVLFLILQICHLTYLQFHIL